MTLYRSQMGSREELCIHTSNLSFNTWRHQQLLLWCPVATAQSSLTVPIVSRRYAYGNAARQVGFNATFWDSVWIVHDADQRHTGIARCACLRTLPLSLALIAHIHVGMAALSWQSRDHQLWTTIILTFVWIVDDAGQYVMRVNVWYSSANTAIGGGLGVRIARWRR